MRTQVRPVRIDSANDARIHLVKAGIRHRDRLGKALGLVVHTARPDRIHVVPIALGLQMNARIAVHFRRRREKEPRPVGRRESERVVCAKCTDLDVGIGCSR